MSTETIESLMKRSLHAGHPLFGTLVTSTAPKSVEALAGLGIDCVMIDTEHIPMGWDALGWMCRAYRGAGIVPIVRIPRADPFEACRALDMGAGGIIAAYIETAKEVSLLRGATKLRPLKGKKLDDILRGRTPLVGELADYIHDRNQNNILLVNIESVAAIEALDEILGVPDLDGVLVGPHDLSCSLGHPEQYDHPAFEQALGRIIAKARAGNVGVGIHNLPRLDQEIRWMKQGANLILHLSDIAFVRRGMGQGLATLRGAMGEGGQARGTGEIII